MDPAPSAAADEAPTSLLRGLTQTLAAYVAARLRLAEIESREAAAHLLVVLVLAGLTGGLLLTAWLIAMPALVWVAAQQVGWEWYRMAFAFAALHMLAALIGLATLRSRLRRLRLFEETLKQFEKDRACLAPPPP